MAEATVVSISVTWKEGTGTDGKGFTYDPSANVTLPGNTTGTANYVVIFTLGGPDGAVWNTTPILWTSTGPPPPLQEGFDAPEPQTNQISISVHNSLSAPDDPPVSFGFHLLVKVNGIVWESPDPELTLDPP
ncbi:MAG: hypothetical protein ABI779_14855 [Acidobacteriota bacterium]